MADTLIGLAELCEKATGPDRELDALIAATARVGAGQWAWANSYPNWEGREDGRVYLEKGGPSFAAPSFTASIDAAMTLVPDTTDVTMGRQWCISRFAAIANGRGTWSADAVTEPLALCAAALRARAAMEVKA